MSVKSPNEACASERGATLVEYSIVLALVVVTMIAGIQILTDSGAGLLNDVGDDISEPRDPEEIVLETPTATPPAGVTPPAPSTILTWVDRPLSTIEGCVSHSGADLAIVACGSPTETPFNGLSLDGVSTEVSLIDGSGCLTGDAGGAVTIQACGGSGQSWLETSASGASLTYQHEDSGLCLQTVVPAAPAPLTLAACDGTSGQIVEVIL